MLIYLNVIDGDQNRTKFENVYNKNKNLMFHVAYSILNNEADSEDAVHTSFMRLAENFENYNQKSIDELCSLCITIVKHISIDIYRRRSKISDFEVEDLVLFNTDINFHPDGYIEQEMQHIYIAELIQKLPENSRIILELKYYQELDNKEISRLLNLKPKTVELRLYRAKEKLQQLIQESKYFVL